MVRSAADLIDELNASDESHRIEAKRAREIGKSVMETVISFSNEPGLGGGWLLLGADWKIDSKGDTVYWAEGIRDPDKIQKDLATQCSNMLNIAIRPEIRVDRIGDKNVVIAFISEVDPGVKPVYLKATGLPKGAFRRIGPTDQRCTDEDLWVLRGASEPQSSPDMSPIADATQDDIDPAAVTEYRKLRTQVNPDAEELNYGDDELLKALSALRPVNGGELKPTLAGIVLFGKSIALRRLLPALRIDYIRVSGTQWVEDPEKRFTTVDIRKPLLLAFSLAQTSIVDELPKGFQLPGGELQSKQEPILPRKVIREALANAVMHRSYQTHSPIQIIRYSNRIEIINPGYSLKEISDLGNPGSRMRNPAIAAVLHEINWAETKGSGIRAMRRLSGEAGLPLPEFISDRPKNEFKVTLFLHNLLKEADYAWIKSFAGESCTGDEAKVLIYARETGAVDNTACRDFTGLDTLQASGLLRRLRDRGLLEKQGAGNRTHYVLSSPEHQELPDPNQGELPFVGRKDEPKGGKLDIKGGNLDAKGGKLDIKGGNLDLHSLPPELAARLPGPKKHLNTEQLRLLIVELCKIQPLRGEQLAKLLSRDLKYLRNKHLTDMVRIGRLALQFPESPNHPNQAYIVPKKSQDR